MTSKKQQKDYIKAIYALGLMWNQYCGEHGHLYMSAGEEASAVLMEAGILKNEWSEIDYDELDKLRFLTPKKR